MRIYLTIAILIFSFTTQAQDKGSFPLPTSGNVTLPLDEYNKLIELANRPAIKSDVPPVSYAIKRADLKLRVASESVLGRAQCDGEIFVKGTTKIPIVSAPAILNASQAGKALPLEQEGGMQTAILAGPAEFSITIDMGIPLSIEAGRASFSLPVPMAGSTQLSLEIPGEHTNVRINPGLITGRSSNGGQTVIEATLVPGQTTSVWWTTREIAAPAVPREVRFLSEIKTLVSVGEADLRLAVLADITVIQGEPAQFRVGIPSGFEITGITGASLESEEIKTGELILKVSGAARRSHQFLISMEKPLVDTKADIPVLGFESAQRETGEFLIEGEGSIELSATERGTLKRMDLKEVNAFLRSLARHPQHAAFRFHRQPSDPPGLALTWNRFPDSSVLTASAERAVITTLVTSEGRSLTEVKLVLKNQAQPFLKVGLPPGASILTADVAGEKVKPVQGPDGSRVPLLRPGFRPSGSYNVEFVMMHAGTPFAKKGDSELNLPKMDIPINLLQWEVFLPELFKVKDFGGDTIATSLLPANTQAILASDEASSAPEQVGAWAVGGDIRLSQLLRGQMGGIIVDASGAVLPGTEVSVTNVDTGIVRTAVSDAAGRWIVSNLQSGRHKVSASSPYFQSKTITDIFYDANRPSRFNFQLEVKGIETSVEISTSAESLEHDSRRIEREAKIHIPAVGLNQASSNVVNLQRRVAGVLPIRVDVPRAGNSYRFVRPLVLDEETRVTFKYKSK
jgi:hypothetical protein